MNSYKIQMLKVHLSNEAVNSSQRRMVRGVCHKSGMQNARKSILGIINLNYVRHLNVKA